MPAHDHRLTVALRRAADDDFPPVDGVVEVVDVAPPHTAEWVVSFTGHAIVATDLAPATVLAQGPDGFGGVLAPRFLLWLAGPAGSIGCQDALLVGRGRGPDPAEAAAGPPDQQAPAPPARTDLDDHPRVRLARRLRPEAAVHGDERGFVTLGRGLGGLWELGIEVPDLDRGRGRGRSLLADALHLVPAGEPVLAQVTPGNARSVRIFLAAGFRPIGSAVAIHPDPTRSGA